MAKDKLARLIHSLIFAETFPERMNAGLKLCFYASGIELLRPIFNEVVCYIGELMSGKRLPKEDDVTPFLQFHAVFHPIEQLLWRWYEDEPLVETLIEMDNDADRQVRALALISLGAVNLFWKDPRVEPHLRARQDDPDPLIRAAARLALEYILWAGYAATRTSPDMVRYQLLEQYAAQWMSNLIKAKTSLS
jgi:hypothetical protein